jgi:Restriction endonuclease
MQTAPVTTKQVAAALGGFESGDLEVPDWLNGPLPAEGFPAKLVQVDLDEALGQFDLVDANLRRLDSAWERYLASIPEGIVFADGSPETRATEDLQRGFAEIAGSLPAIDGFRITASPLDLDEIARKRLDASEIDEPEILLQLSQRMLEPADEMAEYRFRFNRSRQLLVRERAWELVTRIDELLSSMADRMERNRIRIGEDAEWQEFGSDFAEIERLVGTSVPRRGRWGGLKRHLHFAQGVDLCDIAEHDWPSVRADIEEGLYSKLEPLPTTVTDLGSLAESRPQGPVTTRLAWDNLTAEEFERLVFNILGNALGYENARWLTRTYAPDRARDLSVDRVVADSLSGVRRLRVIVQCKHWLHRSLSLADVAGTVEAMKLWEPPPVDVLVIATSGRFSSDAVAWIERHNEERARPTVEPWAESHLESLLTERSHLVAEFGLRAATTSSSQRQ